MRTPARRGVRGDYLHRSTGTGGGGTAAGRLAIKFNISTDGVPDEDHTLTGMNAVLRQTSTTQFLYL